MEFSKQDHWSVLSFPPPGDLPDSGIEPGSPALQANLLLSELPGKSMGSYGLLDKIRSWFLWPRQSFSPGFPTLLALCPQSPTTFVPLLLACGYQCALAQIVKNLPTMQETQVRSLGWEDALEEEMTIHSSILAWIIHGQRSLVGYSPWALKELSTTEVTYHTCILL